MKPYLYLVLLTLCIYSCQKGLPDNASRTLAPLRSSDSTGQQSDTATLPPFPIGSNAPGCPVLPLYGDTLVYPQPTAGDDTILPVNSPGPGKYFAWPGGLALNQNTGAIDLTQSQTGMRYAIGYVRAGTNDTCMSMLIVGGAAYYDSLYYLGDDDPDDILPKPYFNANSSLVNVCSTPGACTFDYNGNAAKKGLIVDPATGTIQIAATVNGKGQAKGLFGSSPKSGVTAVVNISYKLNDGSNNAPQQIMVKIEYYDSPSQIPPGQLNQIQAKTFNAENDRLISTSGNPRPPIIIIVRKH